LIHFTTFGATTSAHRTIALPPACVSCHAHFTICGANNVAGSSVTNFLTHVIAVSVAHNTPHCWYDCLIVSAHAHADFTIHFPIIDAVSPTHSSSAVAPILTAQAHRL
jgi:hypothetical protein